MNRLEFFRSQCDKNRFWWFRQNDYLPDLFANLSNGEFGLLVDWYEETERQGLIGECNVPAMSALLGFVNGNGIQAIVQCGHYAGYSTLLLGWALRRMGMRRALFSMDIDRPVTEFAQAWIERAMLTDIVHLEVANSSDPAMPAAAHEYFWQDPQMVFIDSSHQYEHTLKELNLWYVALDHGGLIFLHDVSEEAQAYDTTGLGGVKRALDEWSGINEIHILGKKVYQDGCGLGMSQKPC